jgi:hypothetical protein
MTELPLELRKKAKRRTTIMLGCVVGFIALAAINVAVNGPVNQSTTPAAPAPVADDPASNITVRQALDMEAQLNRRMKQIANHIGFMSKDDRAHLVRSMVGEYQTCMADSTDREGCAIGATVRHCVAVELGHLVELDPVTLSFCKWLDDTSPAKH